MRNQRRLLLSCLASLVAGLVTPAALAQAERTTIVAPFPPGGPVDTLARILAEQISRRSGQPAVVENLPGAAGNLGIDKVKKARPDGRTLLMIPAGNLTINPTLMTNFPFNIEKDFVAVTMVAKAPNVLVAGPGAKVRDVRELVAAAKARPGGFSYASPGIGSGLHLAGELFKQQTGTDLMHVPYKGTAPALNDVLGGTVPLMFSNLPATLQHIRSGKLVALGVTDSVRDAVVAPEIPTLAELGIPGVVVTSWYGVLAPAGTPPEAVAQVLKDATDALARPEVREQLRSQGLTPVLMKPVEFAAHIKAETATWAGIIKARSIVAE
ncbi:MAG: tripartite tricarboxylate transporter substrate binding protein [Ramlibacter sp.]|jgi:tripartite-type tricarboxylate transporter receptor subunit TctC|uniref:Bug family tripartite tricarboxylate transporter substrate binding protein n=1 Tax=Ramlibacter sp. TaxID=1917967 RepID=UPI002628BE0F|nr:tripartite tricarboxylate transporter substrate binding protein [Ramlibacter sp.]MDH4375092.1 tripartite tricarboxylate transporter substrate binding protein [Ramlibacter sp.]